MEEIPEGSGERTNLCVAARKRGTRLWPEMCIGSIERTVG